MLELGRTLGTHFMDNPSMPKRVKKVEQASPIINVGHVTVSVASEDMAANSEQFVEVGNVKLGAGSKRRPQPHMHPM